MDVPRDSAPSIEDLRQSYNDIPYPDLPKPFTHITRLAAIGRWHGLKPICPCACSVLELGCADGGNLLPMAHRFPESRFVGIDLSPVQIDLGRKRVSDLSLANLDLQTANILDLQPKDLDDYDYIIVHGVYSWVAPDVQQKILALCRDHLSESGLAYISYNTYPGWHGKQALRAMLRYHTRNIDDTQKKVEAVLTLLGALPTPKDNPGDPGTLLFQSLRDKLKHMDDPRAYLVHEYLIDDNEPVTFSTFLSRIQENDLAYVDDAFPGSTSAERLPPSAQAWLEKTVTDEYERQQTIDYFCNVAFRRSLLCRASQQPDNKVSFRRLQTLYVSATCTRTDSEEKQHSFVTKAGRRFNVEHPGLAFMLDRLVDAGPGSVVISKIRQWLGDQVTDAGAADILASLVRSAAVEMTTHPFPCTTRVNARPFASPLVRYQCQAGLVTNAVHQPVRLERAFERQLLALLDGSRDVPELIALLRKRLRPDPPLNNTQWQEQINTHLARLAELGLLSDQVETD